MKRLSFIVAGLALILYAPTALATGSYDSSSTQSQDQNYPPPYTGGASVAKYFHLSDGSTMTITSTGAVVKQARNGTPYRQGWINPADIGHINSFQDLKGRLAYGETNPYLRVNHNMTYREDSRDTTHQSKEIKTSTSAQAAPAVSHYTTTTYNTIPSTKNEPVQPASNAKTLPKTGPGGAIPLAAAATIFSSIGHYIYKRRQGTY